MGWLTSKSLRSKVENMPEPLGNLAGKAAPLDGDDIDTDQIFPSEFLKVTERRGLSRYLFYRWRHDGQGGPISGFVLDEPAFRDASILVTGRNFGIGSSRENAVWALKESGIKCVISSAFGDIFYNNASRNGLLCIRLPEAVVTEMRNAARSGNLMVSVDLGEERISFSGKELGFEIEAHVRDRIMRGTDDIHDTLQNYQARIRDYESRMPRYFVPKRYET
jgi:3-isopropylmalate/(R)-2-methylmalate dehydratase small subunit